MFHKLLKYEFTAVGRELLPVYLMMIAAAILTNIFMPIKAVISSAFALIFLAITVGAMVVTLVTTINRFQKTCWEMKATLCLPCRSLPHSSWAPSSFRHCFGISSGFSAVWSAV